MGCIGVLVRWVRRFLPFIVVLDWMFRLLPILFFWFFRLHVELRSLRVPLCDSEPLFVDEFGGVTISLWKLNEREGRGSTLTIEVMKTESVLAYDVTSW